MIPQYGLDNNIAAAPVSVICSLFLVAGIWNVGKHVIAFCSKGVPSEKIWLMAQSPIVGAAVISTLSLSMALTGYLSRDIARLIAYGLIFLGVIQFASLVKCCLTLRLPAAGMKRNKLPKFLLAVIVIGYFLLSLGPITEADSLDYHVGVAIDILNRGELIAHPEWFHSRLVGGGEPLIAVGLSIGAEQFGAMLQLCGLMSVVAAFIFFRQVPLGMRLWLALLIFSTPVFLAWVASPKPFLLPMSMTTSGLLICYLYLRKPSIGLSSSDETRLFFLVCLLCTCAATMKMNFMVSGFLIALLGSIFVIRRGNFRAFISTAPWVFFMVLAPLCVWRSVSFGGGFFDGFYQAFPGDWPGTIEFESMLREHPGSFFEFIRKLFIPSTLGGITTSFGLLACIIFTLPKILVSDARELGFVAVLTLIPAIILGQWSARFFLEPFCWVALACLLGNIKFTPDSLALANISKFALIAQSVAVVCFLYVGVYTVSAAALSSNWRNSVMNKVANGYDVFEWVNKKLPPGAILVSTLRSVSLAERPVISTDWTSYVNENSPGYQTYLSILNSMSPQFILLTSDKGELPRPALCSGDVYAGPVTTKVSTRNPFNRSSFFDAWLYRIDTDCLEKFKD